MELALFVYTGILGHRPAVSRQATRNLFTWKRKMVIDAELLQILACPVCRGDLEALRAEGATEGADPCGLACKACAVVYPVRDGIPVMLKEEAVNRGEWDKTVQG